MRLMLAAATAAIALCRSPLAAQRQSTGRLEGTLTEKLATRPELIAPDARTSVERLVQEAPRLRARLDEVARINLASQRIRVHGDYHLGQVLDVPEQEVITRDNAMVKVDGVVFYKVLDAAKAAYEVTGLDNAILNLTTTNNIRTVMGLLDLVDAMGRQM